MYYLCGGIEKAKEKEAKRKQKMKGGTKGVTNMYVAPFVTSC